MKTLAIETQERTEFVDITDQVQTAVVELGMKAGAVTVFVPHRQQESRSMKMPIRMSWPTLKLYWINLFLGKTNTGMARAIRRHMSRPG